MTDEAQASDTQPVAQTLDDVIADFNVPAQEATPQNNVSEFTPPQPQHIDPYDEDSLNKWASITQQEQAALKSELQSLKAEAEANRKAEAQKATDAKIQDAVKTIATGIDGIDPLAAEIILEKTARENEKFAHLFHNQDKNPDLYKAALEAVITENRDKFQRVDTQLAENHRAAQQSTQSNNTPTATKFNNSLEERLAGAKNEQERMMIWANAKNGG